MLNNRAGTLRAWFAATADPSHLDSAIVGYRQALEAGAATAIERPAIATNLGGALLDRYELAGAIGDLRSALQFLEETAAGTEEQAPERLGRLVNLANALRRRHALSGDEGGRARAASSYRIACERGRDAVVEVGLRTALNWGAWAIDREAWREGAEAYMYAADASDRLLGQQLTRRDRRAGCSPPRRWPRRERTP
jgi:hypothetical protein